MNGTPEVNHEVEALAHLERADQWANRDHVTSEEFRRYIVDYHLRLAQVHATLAVAQQISMIPLPAI